MATIQEIFLKTIAQHKSFDEICNELQWLRPMFGKRQVFRWRA